VCRTTYAEGRPSTVEVAVPSLQTIDDALSVLEYLANAAVAQPLSRISRDLRISKPRMHRVLSTLVARGYVTRDPLTSHYGFGAMCGSLIAQARAGVTLPQACADSLRRLWTLTRETCYLAVLESDRAIVVDKLDSRLPVIATSILGRALPLHAVSAGKVLLASRPDHEVDALIERSIGAYPDAKPADPARIWNEVRRTRAQGYAENNSGFRDAVGGFAAPIYWSENGRVAAAIAVCMPAMRLRASGADMRDAVIAAAAAASAAVNAAVDAGISNLPKRTAKLTAGALE
jgi:DNA-binding IclR family transcriptional regulator